MDELERISGAEAYARIRDAAIAAAVHFSNGEVSRNWLEHTHKAVAGKGFELRDAVIYRFDAVLHVVDRLMQSQAEAERKVTRCVGEQGRELLRHVAHEQRFAFDDLVFNSIALFDYIGRFAGVLLQADANLKLRWDKAYKWSKHANAGRGANQLHGTRTGRLIVKADQEWVRHLYEFRSDVIHYDSEKVNGRVTTSFRRVGASGGQEVSHEIVAYVPAAFVRRLKLGQPEVPLGIVVAAEHLLGSVFQTTEALLLALGRDLEERGPTLPPDAITAGGIILKNG